MNEETSPTIVALVWMRSASREEGAGVDSPADPSQAEKVADFFREAGFEVSPAQSGQFSIVGPKERFESTFGETIEVETEDGEVRRVSRGDGELVLSLERLPQEVRSGIHVVTFDEPLDFGPSSY